MDAFMTNVKLMFNNCRTYNEEGSDIYNDANTLETVLINKYKELGLYVPTAGQKGPSSRRPVGIPAGGTPGGSLGLRQKPSQMQLTGKALQDKMRKFVVLKIHKTLSLTKRLRKVSSQRNRKSNLARITL